MVATGVLVKLSVQSLRFHLLWTQTEIILLKITFNSSAEQRIQPTTYHDNKVIIIYAVRSFKYDSW